MKTLYHCESCFIFFNLIFFSFILVRITINLFENNFLVLIFTFFIILSHFSWKKVRKRKNLANEKVLNTLRSKEIKSGKVLQVWLSFKKKSKFVIFTSQIFVTNLSSPSEIVRKEVEISPSDYTHEKFVENAFIKGRNKENHRGWRVQQIIIIEFD